MRSENSIGNFYIPSLNSDKELINTKINFEENRISFPLYNKKIQFELIPSIDNLFLEEPSKLKKLDTIINSTTYELYQYSGKHQNYTSMFIGFLPLRLRSSNVLREIWSKHKFALVGFSPNFGNTNWNLRMGFR